MGATKDFNDLYNLLKSESLFNKTILKQMYF